MKEIGYIMQTKPKGRNVINLRALKETLKIYSESKELSEPITRWFEKNFLKWAINNFSPVQVVQSRERFRSLVRGAIPDWFVTNSKEVEFIYIDPKHPNFEEILEKCRELLGSKESKEAHKFYKMSVEQVLQKWEEEHQRLANRKEQEIETSGEALEQVFQVGEYRFVKFKDDHKELPLEMARESSLMQHCLGEFDDIALGEGGYGEYYIELIREKKIFLYSLRNAQNKPHVTIALYPKDNGLWLDQIKGKQNRYPVERYQEACVVFLNHFKVQHHYHPDCLGMGVIFSGNKTKHIRHVTNEKEQQLLLGYNTKWIKEIPNPSASTLWLAHTRDPMVSTELLDKSNDAMKIAALIQQPMLMNQLSFSANIHAKSLLKKTQTFSIGAKLFHFIKLQVGRIV